MVELDCAHVIDVTVQREHALFGLVAPYLDQVVVTTRHENRLGIMKVDSSDRA
jgi:hypothetical protein